MRRTDERRRPKAHPPKGPHAHPSGDSCYRCRHGRGVIRCACRYARRASRLEEERGLRARAVYAARLAAGLVLLSGRRLGPGVALVAARGILPKLAPALGAVPALLKSVWVWLGGFSVAAATALTVTTAPAAKPADSIAAPVALPVAAPVAAPSAACADAPATGGGSCLARVERNVPEPGQRASSVRR